MGLRNRTSGCNHLALWPSNLPGWRSFARQPFAGADLSRSTRIGRAEFRALRHWDRHGTRREDPASLAGISQVDAVDEKPFAVLSVAARKGAGGANGRSCAHQVAAPFQNCRHATRRRIAPARRLFTCCRPLHRTGRSSRTKPRRTSGRPVRAGPLSARTEIIR